MPKFKGGEAAPKSDDLEIVSIGSLYKGPCEKKYWSFSRIDILILILLDIKLLGLTYKTEIHECTKGPLFVGDHVASQAILFSKYMEVDRTSFNKDAFHSNVQEQLVSINLKQETSVYCVEDTDETPMKLPGKDSKAETRAPGTNSSHQAQKKVYATKKVSKQAYSTRKYTVPLSVSIICRNSGDDYAPSKSAMTGTSLVSKSCHTSDNKPCNRDIFGNTPLLDKEKTTTNCKPEISNITPTLSNEDQKLTCVSKAKDASCFLDPSVSLEMGFQENCHKERLEHRAIVENGCSASCQNQVTGSSDVNHYRDEEITSDLKGIVNLVGGYFHPSPILSVLLGIKGNEIHICVSCGLLVDMDRTLFVYKVATEEQRKGCPSFVGYTSVALPSSEIDVERRGLQFTPDGQCLVLLDSIKTPYCRSTVSLDLFPREGRIDCICSICLSGCSKENAVKIVRVNPGYVSLVAKVETVQSVQCILVCENDFLLAAGKSGRLHLWVMNSTWRAAAVGASFDHGIMGRDDGLVYMWEPSTGTTRSVLHHFKGGSVSCIATDEEWRPKVVGVAAGDGQLLPYFHNQQDLVTQ
ncbi:hypothetical protein GQ457_17G015310 [Hibiscus cannabinus]